MASTSGASTGTAEPSVFIRICQWSVQFISICVPVLLAFTGAVGIKQSNVTNANAAASIIFIGIYMIVFAATLFIYELLKISPASMSTYTDSIFKKNFGFLYGAYGRGFYLIMIGIFAFGLQLESPEGLKTATAAVVIFWGVVIALLNVFIPGFFPPETKYVPK